MIPRATYRLQFTPDFGFDDAAMLVPYLALLGVSHLYASPYLKARPGSTHGYDIVDHAALNPELGDRAAFDRMNAALKAHGIRQIVDFVPNHMGVGGSDNPFWLDVLEWGPDAEHAGWFDIEWSPDRHYLQDKLLIPFLGAQYGAALEAGKLQLKFDADTGSFAVWAYDTHKLPVSPFQYDRILGTAVLELDRLGDAFANLRSWRPQIRHRAVELKAELASLVRLKPAIGKAVEASVARFNGREGNSSSWSTLDDLIRDQHWRPAHFRVAADDINYRRFFNIAELAGLRMELPAVFDHAHSLVFELMAEGAIDGLRIDHIDGLLDPKGYLERLREKAPRKEGESFYLVVEKILAEHEKLRPEWPVQGTTGYEVTNLLLGLLVDPAGEIGFTRIYADFTGQTTAFDNMLRQCKKRIMDNEMASELAVLAIEAARIAAQNNKTSDFTRNILRRALREIVACFPVYRTYVDFQGVATEDDRRYLDVAIKDARTRESAIDGSVYDFLESVLTGDLVAGPNSGFSRASVLRCAMKLQQYSGPVMAKGLEDTAFYRYNRFIALNEVGGHPQRFAVPVTAFHAANRERAAHWPHSMLGTSTHDTKRGEDARARLAVLSEFPDEWAGLVKRWSALLRSEADRLDPAAAPDRNDEYAIYQTLLGTWPAEFFARTAADPDAMRVYAERVKGAMTKSLREAKLHSTWASPNADYEAKTLAFVDLALTGERAGHFLPAFTPFAGKIARFGVQNSIVQTVLKLTMPGVPDIYQGTELWDLSMVDPDNRRPVDFAGRARLLGLVKEAVDSDGPAALRRYVADWHEGRIKLAVIAALLAYRQSNEDVFAGASYEPLEVNGDGGDAICGFARRHGASRIIVAVARLPGRRDGVTFDSGTRLLIPDQDMEGTWTDILTSRVFIPCKDGLGASDMFGILPAVVLTRNCG